VAPTCSLGLERVLRRSVHCGLTKVVLFLCTTLVKFHECCKNTTK
jgi:hypothetical protein